MPSFSGAGHPPPCLEAQGIRSAATMYRGGRTGRRCPLDLPVRWLPVARKTESRDCTFQPAGDCRCGQIG
jgi:hypothetical protein